MKKTILVVALALVLTFAFAASAFATTGKFFASSISYYTWEKPAVPSPGTAGPAGLFNIGDNPTNPGVHANYLATTAKCGICHSVHRAKAGGTKLLPTGDATCSGCHTQGTTVTTKIITVATLNPNYTSDGLNGPAGGLGGPHNDDAGTLIEDGYWDGVGVAPAPSYALGFRYGCFTRRCHATNPHGANSSKYKIFAAKLLFNNTPAQDDATYPELVALHGNGTYGGLDAVYNNLGATDAAVARFDAANADITADAATGLIRILGVLPDAAETHALVAGLTCGRPSNAKTGEDECHAEAAYAIVTRNIKENRNHATGITKPGQYATDNTGEEVLGYGGNDHRDSKTGHVAGSFGADRSLTAYAPIAGCTSCHDQTDAANTVVGNFTFPHGQTPTGATNAVNIGGGTGVGVRSRIWSGWSGFLGDQRTITGGPSTQNGGTGAMKAYDGQCLKCHRTFDGLETVGIGLTQ